MLRQRRGRCGRSGCRTGRGAPPLVQIFEPLTTYSSPSRTAARRQAGEVAPGVGLAEQLAPELVAAEDRIEEALLLPLGAGDVGWSAPPSRRRSRWSPPTCGRTPPARSSSSMISWWMRVGVDAVRRRPVRGDVPGGVAARRWSDRGARRASRALPSRARIVVAPACRSPSDTLGTGTSEDRSVGAHGVGARRRELGVAQHHRDRRSRRCPEQQCRRAASRRPVHALARGWRRSSARSARTAPASHRGSTSDGASQRTPQPHTAVVLIEWPDGKAHARVVGAARRPDRRRPWPSTPPSAPAGTTSIVDAPTATARGAVRGRYRVIDRRHAGSRPVTISAARCSSSAAPTRRAVGTGSASDCAPAHDRHSPGAAGFDDRPSSASAIWSTTASEDSTATAAQPAAMSSGSVASDRSSPNDRRDRLPSCRRASGPAGFAGLVRTVTARGERAAVADRHAQRRLPAQPGRDAGAVGRGRRPARGVPTIGGQRYVDRHRARGKMLAAGADRGARRPRHAAARAEPARRVGERVPDRRRRRQRDRRRRRRRVRDQRHRHDVPRRVDEPALGRQGPAIPGDRARRTACPGSASTSRPAPTCRTRPTSSSGAAPASRTRPSSRSSASRRSPSASARPRRAARTRPGMSDYTVFVKGRGTAYLGGPPLVKMAIDEVVDEETLGGAEMHSRASGLSDYLAVDELDALRIARGIVSHLRWRKLGPGPTRTGRRSALRPGRAARVCVGRRARAVRHPRDLRPAARRLRASRSSSRSTATSWCAAGGRSTGSRSACSATTGSCSRRRPRRAPSSSSSATAPTRRSCSCRTSPGSWSGRRPSRAGSSATAPS